MRLGWKVLIPASLVWIIAVSTIRLINLEHHVNRTYLLVGGAIALLIFAALMFVPDNTIDEDHAAAEARGSVGGYPVPPMPSAAPELVAPGPSDEQETIRG
jgi:NADH-quinone oxidoreductase subunit H